MAHVYHPVFRTLKAYLLEKASGRGSSTTLGVGEAAHSFMDSGLPKNSLENRSLEAGFFQQRYVKRHVIYHKQDRLEGKVALITGASAGIERACARALAGEGARLVLTARRQERLDALRPFNRRAILNERKRHGNQ